MLQNFRDYSGSIFIKILFGLLVASFALWGVGDVFRNYTSMRPVVTVGDSAVSQEEFISAYQRAVSNLQNMAKGKLTAENIKEMHLHQKILDELTNNAVLNNQISSLGMVVTDAAVRENIQATPAFHGSNGVFDKRQFDYLISNNGLTEAGFIQQTRNNILKVQLLGGLSYGLKLPKFYTQMLYRGLEEKKIFTVVHIPLTSIKINEKAGDSELETLYTQNQEMFTRPETRQISLLILDPKIQQSRISVSAEQLQQEFEARKKDFNDPETRSVIQLTFASKANAERALQELKNGAIAEQIAASRQANLRTFDDADREQFREEHANVIFALNAGDYSDPQDSALGWAIFGVRKITPEREKTFSEVKGKLEESLKVQLLNDTLYQLKNKIEDAIAGGMALADIAKEYSLTVQVFNPIAKNGLSFDGKSELPAEYKEQILEQGFTLPEGGDSPLIDTAAGTSIVVHVNKVMPQIVPAFADIKDQVQKAWVEIKQQENAAALAQNIVKEVKSTNDLTMEAKKHSLVVKVLPAMSRSDVEGMKKPEQGIDPRAILQGFALAKDQATVAVNADGFVVLMVNKVIPFEESKEPEKAQTFAQNLNLMANRDFTALYVKNQRQVQKVSINQSILDNLINRSN